MTDNPVDEQQADLRISAEGQSLRLAKRGAGARTYLSRGVTGRGDVQVRRRDNFPTDGPDDERTRGRQRWHARRQARGCPGGHGRERGVEGHIVADERRIEVRSRNRDRARRIGYCWRESGDRWRTVVSA